MRLQRATPAPQALEVATIGRIEGCTSPESADLAPDGETLVFGNCAHVVGAPAYRSGRGIVYLRGKSFVTRARLDRRAGLVVDERTLIAGLTGTHGIEFVKRATPMLPAGAALLCEQAGPQMEPGADVTLPKDSYTTCILAFDPATGAILGRIPLGCGSELSRRFNDIEQPNGIAVTADGAIHVSDMAAGNHAAAWPPLVHSAIYRIAHEAIDNMIAGGAGSADAVERIVTPGFTNGLAVSNLDGALLAVSCSDQDPSAGAIHRIRAEDFAAGRQPAPDVGGLGVLDGGGETRRGTLIGSNPRTGDIHVFTQDGEHRVIVTGGVKPVRAPADLNVCYPPAFGGEPILIVTDINPGGAPGEASVVVLDLSGL